MASNYQVVTSYRTIQVLSATTTQDAEYCVCSTIPSNIGFNYAIPLEVWNQNKGGESLGLIAGVLENLVANDHVVGGTGVQDIDSSGLLSDNVDLVVEYDRAAPGLAPLQGTVSIPIGIILLEGSDPEFFGAGNIKTPAQLVGEEYDRLKTLAGG